MDEFIASALQWLGGLFVAAVGGGAIALGVMRFFGQQWLTNEFAKRLEAFKHEQQKEMEQVRYRINSYFDRAVRLHQVEFEVLPELWGRLVDAFDTTTHFTSFLQQFPDVDKMNAEHLEEFLAKSPFMEWQKRELRESKNKGNYYVKAIFWHHLNETKRTYREFNTYLTKRGIFLPVELRQKFDALSDMIWRAIIEREVAEDPGARMIERPSRDKLETEGTAVRAEIQAIVEAALRDSKSLFANA